MQEIAFAIFLTFSERISQINIDVIHRISEINQTPDGADTFFFETLQKWVDLNYTEDFDKLCKDLGSDIQTLPQIVHKQEQIVEILNSHLQDPTNLSLNATLELIVALARDLQKDFYSFFPKLFSSIINLLDTKDTELLENVFTCLSYLFKFLWRYMTKDIEKVYCLYLPLLQNNRKEYIHNFAAESIAFLMRKIRDKEKFFIFIFKKLEDDPKIASGVSKMLFHIMKGVKKEFHSCTDIIFPILIKCLGQGMDIQEELPWEQIQQILVQMMTLMAVYVEPKHSLQVWKLLYDSINKLLQQLSAESTGSNVVNDHLDRLISMFQVFVEHHQGKLIIEPNDVGKVLLHLLQEEPVSVHRINHTVKCVITLFNGHYEKLSLQILHEIIDYIYSDHLHQDIILDFTRKMFVHPFFEKEFLPSLLKYLHHQLQTNDVNEDKVVLNILTEYVTNKIPTVTSGQDLNTVKTKLTLIGNNSSDNNIGSLLLKNLTPVSSKDELMERFPQIWGSLVCLPHVRNMDNKVAMATVATISDKLYKMITEDTEEVINEELLCFVLCQALITLIQLDAGVVLFAIFSSDVFAKLISKHPSSVNALLLLDIFLTHIITYENSQFLSYRKLSEIPPILFSNLMSPFHKVRMLTLRILDNCSTLQITKKTPIFKLCLSAEIIPVTFQETRHKLQLLQKLNYEHVQKVLNYDIYKQVPVQYLIGMLYVNFKLLWQPVIELITSHACNLGNEFWKTFVPHLTSIYKIIEETQEDLSTDIFEIRDKMSTLMHEKMILSTSRLEKPDHINHRILLWKSMDKFPAEAEMKNKHLVILLFQFIRNEFQIGFQLDEKPASNKKQKHNKLVKEKNNTAENEDDEEEDIKHEGFKKETYRKGIVTLRSHLAVFSKFKNPKAFYQYEELHKLYNDFLSFRDPEVQKLAFDCLMTYNHKNLKPYVDNFRRLLDNKTFKTEIVLFNLDSESGIVQNEHRNDILQVLMRILYGKMLCKTGKDTSGKNQAQTRRNIVLRFLAGCSETEMQTFLDIAFLRFKDIIKDDVDIIVKNIQNTSDLINILPPRVLNSALNTLGTFFTYLGNLMPNLLPELFKILIAVTTTTTTLLENQNSGDSKSFLKSVRTAAIRKIIQFFNSYDSYPFSSSEIDALFDSVVWHLLPRLEKESLHHCSPLLCLFAAWTENPRYFPLLVKYYPTDPALSPLPCIMKLYASGIKPLVVHLITDILERMLTLTVADASDTEMEQTEPEITVNNCLIISYSEFTFSAEGPSYGTILLLPYVQQILQRIKSSLQIIMQNPKKLPSSKELLVLSRISDFITNPDQVSELLQILIIILSSVKKLNQDMECEMLTVICKLIKQVNFPETFLQRLAPLFSSLSHQKSRMLLCDVLTSISEIVESVQDQNSVICKINAWNPQQLEEPDYFVRLEGYKKAVQMLDVIIKEENVDYLLMLVHNCIFFIKTTDDLSLRDNASNFLQKLAKELVKSKDSHKQLFSVIVKQTLMMLIKNGIRSKTETVRHEFIKILSSLLHSQHSLKSLKELSQLCNEDEEVDFWENIRHIQIHRRTRAMARLMQNLKSGSYKFHSTTLTAFLVPIASSFLYDSTYIKHNHLIDSAIEVIGAVCEHLPWHRYFTMLQFYLGVLLRKPDFHKVSIKLIVTVLNSFHFDLANSQGINEKNASISKDDNAALQTDMSSEDINCEDDTTFAVYKEKLDKDLAATIHKTLVMNLLPKLHSSLSDTLKQDEHKLASHIDREDEIVLRLPIALAMVKLLQNLPHGMLEQNISGIFLKMCQLLKSRADSVREVTRETLVKIMQSLGPKYLWYLFREMRAMLKRGYQLHVLTYTVHAVLINLQDQLKVGDLDGCIDSLTQMCNDELFGKVAEEKEVEKIIKKLKEAGVTKSYSMYQILGKYASDAVLKNLVMPLSEVLATTHSHKTLLKVQECLRHVVTGLSENGNLNIETALIFVHGLVRENAFQCIDRRKKQSKKDQLKKADSYIIPKEPQRGVVVAKYVPKTNSHIMVEFGLQLFNSYLKKEKLSASDQKHLEKLDPFVPILKDCLESTYAKMISLSLRCFVWLLTFPLPSLQIHIANIVTNFFLLLNKYAGIGMAHGDNFEIVVMCFKSLTVLLRSIDYYTVTEDQLKILLSYIEQDIHDHTRQGTAFNLLKAIVSRELNANEIYSVAEKIAELSIISKQEHVRSQCRQIYLLYLNNYVRKRKDMTKALTFYVVQLEYEHEYGRISSLEMLNSVFSNFTLNLLKLHSGLFLIPLSARLINDSSSQCRNLAALAIKKFLSKVDEEERTNLFSIVIAWLQNTKMSLRRLGAQLCGIFAEVEKEAFQPRLLQILQLFQEELEPSKYDDIKHDAVERSADHILYHLLNAFFKIISSCPNVYDKELSDPLNCIWDHIRRHLLHPHLWVQLIASQLFGLLFSLYSVEDVVNSASNDSTSTQYLLSNTKLKLQLLLKDFCKQFSNPDLTEALAEQVLKNLIYLAKILYQLRKTTSTEDDEFSGDALFNRLIKNICREANKELVKDRKIILKRTCAFKFIAVMVIDVDQHTLMEKLTNFLTPLCREITDKSVQTDSTLKSLAQEVLDLISKTVGTETFTDEYSRVQNFITQRRVKRKQENAAEAVTNPQKFALKKIKRQLNKKKAVKRKIMKPGKPPKKIKLSNMAIIT